MWYPIDGLITIPFIPEKLPEEPNKGNADMVNFRSFFFDWPNPFKIPKVRNADNSRIFFIEICFYSSK